jgi:predicted RNA polymerase sigma factor
LGISIRPKSVRRKYLRPLWISARPPASPNSRAAGSSNADGLRSGLDIIDALTATGDLNDYHLLHAARADLLAPQWVP